MLALYFALVLLASTTEDWMPVLQALSLPAGQDKTLLDFLVRQEISVETASQLSLDQWFGLNQFGLPLGHLLSLQNHFRKPSSTPPTIPKSNGASFKKEYKWIRSFPAPSGVSGSVVFWKNNTLLVGTGRASTDWPDAICGIAVISAFDGRVFNSFRYNSSYGRCSPQIAVDKDFNILISDPTVYAITMQVWDSNLTFSFNMETHVNQFGLPLGPAVAFDNSRRLIITGQQGPYSLYVFPPKGGKPVWQKGPSRSEYSICDVPSSILVDSVDNLLLLCSLPSLNKPFVQLWNSDGKFLKSYPLMDANSTVFYGAYAPFSSFLLDREGQTALSDATGRIMIFSPEGDCVYKLENYDAPDHLLDSPANSLLMDSQGNLLVSSRGQIAIFG